MSENKNYTVVATKISQVDKIKLAVIADSFKLSFYELLQSLLLALVRYFDKDSPASDERETMLRAFGNIIEAQSGGYNPLSFSHREQERTKRVIAFVEKGGKQAPQPIAISQDDSGAILESYNIDDMLSWFLQAVDPNMLQWLTMIKHQQGCFSLFHALHDILLEQMPNAEESMKAEIDDLFKDIRLPDGQEITDDVFFAHRQQIKMGESCILQAYKEREFSIDSYS